LNELIAHLKKHDSLTKRIGYFNPVGRRYGKRGYEVHLHDAEVFLSLPGKIEEEPHPATEYVYFYKKCQGFTFFYMAYGEELAEYRKLTGGVTE